MPSTGSPNLKRPGSAGGASLSYTDHGAPESTMPTGAQLLISSSEAVQGSTTEKTFCSRMRRAMSCIYCAPKSRMTIDWVRGDWVSDDRVILDWGSTDEFLKSRGLCKEPCRGDAASYVDVSTARLGRSLRIGSWRSIEVCSGRSGGVPVTVWASGISAMHA